MPETMPAAFTITLNGKPRSFESIHGPAAMEALLTALELKPDRIAVELNGTIVARRDWPQTTVSSGDKLEVVHFVGGGAA